MHWRLQPSRAHIGPLVGLARVDTQLAGPSDAGRPSSPIFVHSLYPGAQLAVFHTSFPLTLLTCVGFLGAIGCQPDLAPTPARLPNAIPAETLDFHVPAFDALFNIQLLGEGMRPIENATLLMELSDLRTSQSRIMHPKKFDGDAWAFKVNGVSDSESAILWIYEKDAGLAAFGIKHDELRISHAPLRFAVVPQTNDSDRLKLQFLDPNGKPLPSLKVGVARMFPHGSGAATTVPNELWETCREVTDQNGWATLRVANAASVTDVQSTSVRYGRQTIPLRKSNPEVLRHARTGLVRLLLDESVADIDVHELVLNATNDLGVSGPWSIAEPQPGEYEVRLPSGDLFLNSFSDNRRGLLVSPTAQPYAVPDGGTLEVAISGTQGCVVSGRLVSMDGSVEKPVTGAQMSIYATDSIQRSHNMVTNERGEFSTRLAPGEFTMSRAVRLPGKTSLFFEDPLSGVVTGSERELDIGTLTLPRLFTLRGKVVDVKGRPLVFAQVSCLLDGRLVGGGTTGTKGEFTAIATSDEIEEFSIWPNEVYGRFKATVVQDNPLTLEVR